VALNGYAKASLNQTPENIDIAPVDLNNDGLNEFVLKSKDCDSRLKSCSYWVVSETDAGIMPLGELEGRVVRVDSQSVQGVRNLLVYESGINDYEHVVYVWEPQASRYMMAKDR
jgi:hypothetical protein